MTEVPAVRPLDPHDPDVRRLALIELAQQRGMPWAAICAALGARDKNHAKKIKVDLERRIRAKRYAVSPTPVPERMRDGAR